MGYLKFWNPIVQYHSPSSSSSNVKRCIHKQQCSKFSFSLKKQPKNYSYITYFKTQTSWIKDLHTGFYPKISEMQILGNSVKNFTKQKCTIVYFQHLSLRKQASKIKTIDIISTDWQPDYYKWLGWTCCCETQKLNNIYQL